MKNIVCFWVVSILLVLASGCSSEEPWKLATMSYIENRYQYTVKEDGVDVIKYRYWRKDLKKLEYRFYKNDPLSQEQQALGFRTIVLNFYSENALENGDPTTQPIGATIVKVELIDTLRVESKAPRLLPFDYNIATSLPINPSKTALPCTLAAYMNQRQETDLSLKYEFSFKGENNKKVRILDLGNGVYQIIANGTTNPKAINPETGQAYTNSLYNLYYYGNIYRGADIE